MLVVLECALREVGRGSRIAELFARFFLPGAVYALFLGAPMCTSWRDIFASLGGMLCSLKQSIASVLGVSSV